MCVDRAWRNSVVLQLPLHIHSYQLKYEDEAIASISGPGSDLELGSLSLWIDGPHGMHGRASLVDLFDHDGKMEFIVGILYDPPPYERGTAISCAYLL